MEIVYFSLETAVVGQQPDVFFTFLHLLCMVADYELGSGDMASCHNALVSGWCAQTFNNGLIV